QAEDGIRDFHVTGVQTCALPIFQANMDPKHRDRIAFVRVCSGHFEAGMQVNLVRTGKPIRLSAPTQFLARERTIVEEAWPGDVRSEEHTSELQSRENLVCRLLLE